MCNVVWLFGDIQIENPADSINVRIAEANFLAMSAELERAIKTLSKQFDAIAEVINSRDNPEARKKQDEVREALTAASLELSQAIRKFPSRRASSV
jgi:hypothetical protein